MYTEADWAGCHVTRKSTTGFVIQFLGTPVHFGFRTQAGVAFSSAESEFYAVGIGATESALRRISYKQNLLQGAH